MHFFRRHWLALYLITLEELLLCMSIAVKFPHKGRLYIAPGRILVLEAQFQLQPHEIKLLTWDCKNSLGEVRLITNKKTNNNRASVEKDGALLRITGVTESDYGLYKVTVTDGTGVQVSDSIEVLKTTKLPKASLAMQCSVQSEGVQWDSPVFSWQVNGVKVTNETAQMSADGSTLHLSENLDQNYTCITDSSQGTSTVEVHIKAPVPPLKPGPDHNSSSALIAVVVIETVIIGGLSVCIIMLYRWTGNQRREIAGVL